MFVTWSDNLRQRNRIQLTLATLSSSVQELHRWRNHFYCGVGWAGRGKKVIVIHLQLKAPLSVHHNTQTCIWVTARVTSRQHYMNWNFLYNFPYWNNIETRVMTWVLKIDPVDSTCWQKSDPYVSENTPHNDEKTLTLLIYDGNCSRIFVTFGYHIHGKFTYNI